jgi:hypothetical protein
MSLHDYLETFRQAIEKIEVYGYTDSVEIKEELRPNRQAVIKAKIVFINNSVLHIREYIDAKYTVQKVSYAYHYQDKDGVWSSDTTMQYIGQRWDSKNTNIQKEASSLTPTFLMFQILWMK